MFGNDVVFTAIERWFTPPLFGHDVEFTVFFLGLLQGKGLWGLGGAQYFRTDKKRKLKFSSYIRKFKVGQLQSHIRGRPS
jgi:hypothetical protein